ncbi:uncharacterized protein LOC143201128 [Rhynchophorus ferrugineus]|uniref:uncharacterized protein LOC143201128 n=1 Tax=Rhynchophorus ferrugineus TaxID=354439 RepID=UPI003FCCF5CB
MTVNIFIIVLIWFISLPIISSNLLIVLTGSVMIGVVCVLDQNTKQRNLSFSAIYAFATHDGDMERRAFSDPNLLQVIHLLSENINILEATRCNIASNNLPLVINFTEEFEELKSVAEIKLYMTGTEEDAKDKELREAFKSNRLLTDAIEDLQYQLKHQKEELSSELNDKLNIYKRYVDKLIQLKKQFHLQLKQNIYESDIDITKSDIKSEVTQTDLTRKLNNIINDYDAVLNDHLVNEKILRMNRNKTEEILKNVLERYDHFIGEKQFEYEELKKEYDEEMEIKKDLHMKLQEQEVEYVTLMKEKEEEEERMFLEIANEILINRSAKVIQRAWRAFRERKSKRKGKKGKKGKAQTKK